MTPRPGSLLVLLFCDCGAYFTSHNMPPDCSQCGGSLVATTPVTAAVRSVGEQQAFRLGL